MSPEDLAAIEARVKQATPGPWSRGDIDQDPLRPNWRGDLIDGDFETGRWPVCASAHSDEAIKAWDAGNAQFIAHARQDVPALVAEVRRLRAEAELEDAIKAAQDDLQAFMHEHECQACLGSGCKALAPDTKCRCLPSLVCTCDHCERCMATRLHVASVSVPTEHEQRERKNMTRRRETCLDVVERAWPLRGPCAFCCDGDARHRVLDTIFGRHAAGDSVPLLARDYGVSRYEIRALLVVCAQAT